MDKAASAPLQSASGDGPGARIRRAREHAGLSIGEFATQLRLTVPTLEALERDDFRKLREPVYVRGYYRKVAKLLPLDERELIAAYERVAAPQAAVAAMPGQLLLASSESDRRFPRPTFARPLLIAASLGAIAVVAGMFLHRERMPSSTPVAVESPVPAEPAAATTVAAPPAPVETVAAATPIPAAAPAGTAAGTNPAATSTQEPASSPAAPSPPAEATPPVAVGPEAPAVATGHASSAEPSSSVLTLDFHARCWAEVFDASGRRLLSGMVQAGAHETLVGKPPYSVFLGDAPKVDVVYGGQHVDISGRVRDNATARFQIPLN